MDMGCAVVIELDIQSYLENSSHYPRWRGFGVWNVAFTLVIVFDAELQFRFSRMIPRGAWFRAL
jgi:hypothetical protein